MRVESGTTSACAENTLPLRGAFVASGNYLRVRGEYDTRLFARSWWWELPPRARRIPKPWLITAVKIGTTSACAENTPPIMAAIVPTRNYLRVRGEYHFQGLTQISHRNYLRVRGEYNRACASWCALMELPPRARRIRLSAIAISSGLGTTSACAENTPNPTPTKGANRNYLRVRGEYHGFCASPLKNTELPPRARRILAEMLIENAMAGTTSACAENTRTS